MGHDWGLTTFSPSGLRTAGLEPFIAAPRAAMRHAGGVRIDHAMGLTRLWLIRRAPVDYLVRLLALESHSHRAIVIGEDLGIVPPEFRRRCKKARLMGMDVLWFQRHGDGYLPPAKWREDAVAMSTTHDLPTVDTRRVRAGGARCAGFPPTINHPCCSATAMEMLS